MKKILDNNSFFELGVLFLLHPSLSNTCQHFKNCLFFKLKAPAKKEEFLDVCTYRYDSQQQQNEQYYPATRREKTTENYGSQLICDAKNSLTL